MSDQPIIGKTARNEQRKIKATFYNNTSVALTAAGFLVPFFTIDRKRFLEIQQNHRNNIPPTNDDFAWLAWASFVFMIVLTVVYFLRRKAERILSEIEE